MNRIIQLNHPSSQLKFNQKKLGNTDYKDFYIEENKIIRSWNNHMSHFRKFISSKGNVIDSKNELHKEKNLLFWGEWESESFFEPITTKNIRYFPNGIHTPIFPNSIKGSQNTDPFVFGDTFHYYSCKQTKQMQKLDENDVILFGGVFEKRYFVLDTVFVVSASTLAVNEMKNNFENYSECFRNTTLNIVRPSQESNLKIYHGKMYDSSSQFFSFSPCKIDNKENRNGFARVVFDLNSDSTFKNIFLANPTGKKVTKTNTNEIWNDIVKYCFDQGFLLGVKFDEPIKDLNNG